MVLSECSKDNDNKTSVRFVQNKRSRFGKKEALEFLQDVPMGELMRIAHDDKCSRFPGKYATFVFDTNPNYTNVCVIGCLFCAFHRKINDPDAYLLTPEQLVLKVKRAEILGATTVLLQGGCNPVVRLKDWLLYIKAIKSECPNVHIHPFSPVEYFFMAEQEGVTVNYVLSALWDEGIRTIPGGGAEILVENVRKAVAANKITSEEWLGVCETAHKIGFKSTATMMFGHIETDEDIVTHLLNLRSLQDVTGGFTSFIPWSFKPANTLLGNRISNQIHPAKYVRIIATARLILDNFPHIQASWFSESIRVGQLGLLAGADDFGGIILEENVHREAGHDRSASLDSVVTIIRRTGFIPAQRDSNYNIIKIY